MKYYVEVINGETFWYKDAKCTILHREDGPAAIYEGGYQYWYINGKRHREDGPAIISADGSQYWYINGKRHREDGPASICPDGAQAWCINDKYHRADGPAIIYANGVKEWWLDGKFYSEEGFHAKTNPVKELTVADIEKLLGHRVKIVK